jgi:AcrR family transcriptional regulator
MEGATARSLAGERAQRIVEAMRRSVARHGAAASTFDRVARDAGVSRGLLHYYFGTKERLLAEVVRRDSDMRMELIEGALATALTADDFIERLVASLEDIVENDPDFVTLLFELYTHARRNEEIAMEYADLLRRTRKHVAGLLAAKHEEGVLRLQADPEAVAEVIFALADGMALRMLIEQDRDFAPSVLAAAECVRTLIVRGN